MTDPRPPSARRPTQASEQPKMAPPKPKPQPTASGADSTASDKQRPASSVSTTSTSRPPQPPQTEALRRQASREGTPLPQQQRAPSSSSTITPTISSSQRIPSAPTTTTTTSSGTMKPPAPGAPAMSELPEAQPTISSSLPIEQQQPPTPMTPLFTLINNATTHTSHHPRVHYIFSDDEENEALAQALNHASHRQLSHQLHDQRRQRHHGSSQERQQPPRQQEQQHGGSSSRTGTGTTGGGSLRPLFQNIGGAGGVIGLGVTRSVDASEDSLLPGPGVRERVVIVDIAPRDDRREGWEVKKCRSLSDDWAVVGARVGRVRKEGQPCHDPQSQHDDGEEGNPVMLRIEGVEGGGTSAAGLQGGLRDGGSLEGSGGRGTASESLAGDSYGGLVDEFERRMGVLRRVVEATGEGGAGEDGGDGNEEVMAGERLVGGVPLTGLGVVEEESATEGER